MTCHSECVSVSREGESVLGNKVGSFLSLYRVHVTCKQFMIQSNNTTMLPAVPTVSQQPAEGDISITLSQLQTASLLLQICPEGEIFIERYPFIHIYHQKSRHDTDCQQLRPCLTYTQPPLLTMGGEKQIFFLRIFT